jgi:hypothetical protein
MSNEEQNALMNHFWNTIGRNTNNEVSHDYMDRVYCVFYMDGGVSLLEKIFKLRYLAENYISNTDNPSSYTCECWSIN